MNRWPLGLILLLLICPLVSSGQIVIPEESMAKVRNSLAELRRTADSTRAIDRRGVDRTCEIRQDLRTAGRIALTQCGCVSDCLETRKHEYLDTTKLSTTGRDIEQAAQFCHWAALRIQNFSEYKSEEIRQVVQSNCRQLKCSAWYLDPAVTTVGILSVDQASEDTLKKCFPYMHQIFRDLPEIGGGCGDPGVECDEYEGAE